MPTSPTPISLKRQRFELALLFELPAKKKQDLRELQCRLRVNGTTCRLYGSGVFVLASMWNADRQQLEGHDAEALIVNRTLSEIRAQHRGLMQDLIRVDQEPIASLVSHHWLTGQVISPRLSNLFDEYVQYLRRLPLEERKSISSLHKWYLGHRLLEEYLDQTRRPDLTLSEVNPSWARTYYQWLRERPLSIDYAARYVTNIREILHFAVERDLIAYNKLQSLTIVREAAKPIMSLSPQQVEQLAALEDLPSHVDQVRRWALFCCYTGLDYMDAVAFTRNPFPHIHQLPYGEKIVWRRLKFKQVRGAYPEWGVCHIPLLPEAKKLLIQVHEWQPFYIQNINRNLHRLAKRMNLPFQLTTKVCRKTAGALFLLRGYQSEAVRKIMGIKSLNVFERNYMLLLGELVDNNMEMLSRQQPIDKPAESVSLVPSPQTAPQTLYAPTSALDTPPPA